MGITKYIFQKLMGWKIEGSFDPAVKKAVVIVAPHTSWHDFYIGAFSRKLLKTEISYIAKKELFRWPYGWYFKWMGGTPIDRTPGQQKVEAIAQIFDEKEEFRLAMSPEGTRRKVLIWKTGYYYIATMAKVPIICVAFDYLTKTVLIRDAFYPTGNMDGDTLIMRAFYKGIVGKKKAYS